LAAKAETERSEGGASSNGELGTRAPAVVPRMRSGIGWPDDIQVIVDKDPAAKNIFEVLLYQSLHAVLLHRLAHRIYVAGVPVLPRLISQIGRLLTGGIEIHPGAKIGRRFFIDHGSGVVIGETAEIGDDVMLYHQVTLGATGWWKDLNNGRKRRHPKIEDRVTIGVGASVLGPVTLGHDSKIGAMSLVLEDVPPKSVVISRPGSYLVKEGKRVKDVRLQESEVPSGYREVDYQI
jgi:serine O-acetyltransferase